MKSRRPTDWMLDDLGYYSDAEADWRAEERAALRAVIASRTARPVRLERFHGLAEEESATPGVDELLAPRSLEGGYW